MVLRIFQISIGFLLLFSCNLYSQENVFSEISGKQEKKINKVLSKTFNSDDIKLTSVILSDSVQSVLDNPHLKGKFWKVNRQDSLIAYMVFTSAKGRLDYFDLTVIYDTDLRIKNIEILDYRSDHGYQITNKKWLSQFYGKKGCDLNYPKDIDAISGATISANSITNKVDQLCGLLFVVIDCD